MDNSILLLDSHFYSAWRTLADTLINQALLCGEEDRPTKETAILSLWNLSISCKTLHIWLGKTTWPRAIDFNAVAAAFSRSEHACCICHAKEHVYEHTLHPLHPLCCAKCEYKSASLQYVSASAAQRLYGVRDKAVTQLERFTMLDGKWGPYRAYLLSDVLALPPEAKIKRRSAEAKLRARTTRIMHAEQKAAQQAQRKMELAEALAKMGLELRSDSRLCDIYITGEPDSDGHRPKLGEVVERMAQMKMLHEYWSFERYKQEILCNADGEWIPHQELFDMIEECALAEHGGHYPDHWPGLEGGPRKRRKCKRSAHEAQRASAPLETHTRTST